MPIQFRTIQDMIKRTYGGYDVNKADDPVISSTSGYANNVYGAMAFSQLNNEGNVFAALPKFPWQHSGFRVITADAGATADGGIAETSAIPDSDKPTIVEVDVAVKQISHVFEVSKIQEGLVQTADDRVGDINFMRKYYATLHSKRINQQLLVDGNTLAGNNMESIDRVTISSAAATALSWTANDEDIYDIDRSASSWSDAVVSHNSGTDRVLTDDLIRDTLATLSANGARTNLIVTGSDTLQRIAGIFENQVRYAGVFKRGETIKVGINGVETEDGIGVGIRVATFQGIPIIVSQSVTKDTISRIYLLDTTEQEGTGIPRLGISLLYPTIYVESKDYLSLDKFVAKGAYYTAGELICTFFKGQGSIRDLM